MTQGTRGLRDRLRSMTGVEWRKLAGSVALIVAGTLIYAVGVDAFEIPVGIAAGGVTGLATVLAEVGSWFGLQVPVGLQTIAMNALLLALAARSGSRRYLASVALGAFLCGFFTDLLAPVVPMLGGEDLVLCTLWGGVVTGVGLGLVFRAGGNTGGTDILAQWLAKRTGMSTGAAVILLDGLIVAASAPVFSVEKALYAAVTVYLSGKVIDAVVDGPRSQRAAYIISDQHDLIANKIMYDLDRGCTELQARGVWSGNDRPVLFVVLGRGETAGLKRVVAECDPDAIVIISEVHEVFGEGFKQIDPR